LVSDEEIEMADGRIVVRDYIPIFLEKNTRAIFGVIAILLPVELLNIPLKKVKKPIA
jgi:hypothetical protein